MQNLVDLAGALEADIHQSIDILSTLLKQLDFVENVGESQQNVHEQQVLDRHIGEKLLRDFF